VHNYYVNLDRIFVFLFKDDYRILMKLCPINAEKIIMMDITYYSFCIFRILEQSLLLESDAQEYKELEECQWTLAL
jgi:hypothetical protein